MVKFTILLVILYFGLTFFTNNLALINIFMGVFVIVFIIALFGCRNLAKKGNAKAQFMMGSMYAKGWGLSRNYKKAIEWFNLAAEQGQGQAQHNLGFLYTNGLGVPQDYQKAIEWYKLAAEQGLSRAQYNLGLMHGQGRGVPEDFVIALMWFNLAASNGHIVAKKLRNALEKDSTSNEIEKAQKLAQEWLAKNDKES